MLKNLQGTYTEVQEVGLIDTANIQPFAALGTVLVVEDIQTLAQPTLPEISRAMTRWCFKLQAAGNPLVIHRVPLDAEGVGVDMLQMLTTDAMLSLDVPADTVMPLHSIGRTVIMDYTPHQEADPPVPLMSLFDLSRETFGYHANAVKLALMHDGKGVIQAIRLVMRDAIGADMTREELFAYVSTMLALCTGSYRQRYGPGHVPPAR